MTLDVSLFTLTDTPASEHFYMAELRDALSDRDVRFVDDWQAADVVHLFEVNLFTRAAFRAFRFPTLGRIIRSETPLIISTDDLYFIDRPELTERPGLYRVNYRIQRRLLDAADGVIAISESVRDALTDHLDDPNSVHVVHHGVDDRYRQEDPALTNGSAPFVLHVSLASKRKNPEAVIETSRRLDSRVVLAGSGWPDLIPDSKAFANVETPGYVPEDDLVDLYKSAAIFYFPTLHEGFGLPVLEAMAARTAVVTSDVYSVPEVTGDAAITHDPHDVAAHETAIRALLRDPDRRQSLAERARKRSEQFTWDRSAAETVACYRAVLGR